ncbi:hypothetical protein F0Q53_04100 [Anaplasma marginale]|uniref:Uncharacterized protein n=1 Tax=Anaplasma marginale TaxID=770 RepID=A0A643CKL0_ANAMA|nr:hypothetical protein [Anaplasma marginale]KAA8472102.1 hypothetical protein F0Q58_04435 [Anaplasma marginale]KAA8473624.1 hypothetical protein F0Q53_04100 [Anaplasma marginale]KAB0450756.1 hypothetical protein FY210_02900 [Anaplasma marginale]KAB0451206.1 hypothetical protein FY207_04395 [Anaplasma marginale]KAB0452143.1 hypothetical protein FY192_03280 [Anaplasma marginale]
MQHSCARGFKSGLGNIPCYGITADDGCGGRAPKLPQKFGNYVEQNIDEALNPSQPLKYL